MKPELDESLLSQFHVPIVGGAKREQATRAMPPLSGTINAPVEYLDLATVIKVSQAVSGEIVQERQLEILMRTAEFVTPHVVAAARPVVRAKISISAASLAVLRSGALTVMSARNPDHAALTRRLPSMVSHASG